MNEVIQKVVEEDFPLAEQSFSDDLDEEVSEIKRFLMFDISHKVFGININTIKEIIEHGNITKVPMAPPYIRGVINLRGNVVPIIDLAVRLGFEPKPTNKRSCFILVEVAHEDRTVELGCIVDCVDEVMDIPSGEVKPAPEFGSDIHPDFIEGLGLREGSYATLLDVNKVLSIQTLSQLVK